MSKYLPDYAGVFCLAVFLISLTTIGGELIRDGDSFWHTKVGTVMLEEQGLINTDIFSHTAFGTPWTAHEWLSEIIMASLLFTLVFLPKDVNALDVKCEIPNSIICEISDPDGFVSVRVNVDFGDLGQIDVVNHTFPTCRTSATVSWNPIVPNFQVYTTKCKPSGDFKFEEQSRINSAPKVYARNFKVESDESERSLLVKEIMPVVEPLPIENLVGKNNMQYILKEECEWTNDNVASCLVWDCGSDGICVDYGSYCVDHNGNTVPCP